MASLNYAGDFYHPSSGCLPPVRWEEKKTKYVRAYMCLASFAFPLHSLLARRCRAGLSAKSDCRAKETETAGKTIYDSVHAPRNLFTNIDSSHHSGRKIWALKCRKDGPQYSHNFVAMSKHVNPHLALADLYGYKANATSKECTNEVGMNSGVEAREEGRRAEVAQAREGRKIGCDGNEREEGDSTTNVYQG
ncbi:hypothetical protein K438DRAFT_1773413 [Mycena galopus ATCC 62051]|nr:hypothetical protein K438DRAFT_1773413 [Mycena galopus ATCC 62051]